MVLSAKYWKSYRDTVSPSQQVVYFFPKLRFSEQRKTPQWQTGLCSNKQEKDYFLPIVKVAFLPYYSYKFTRLLYLHYLLQKHQSHDSKASSCNRSCCSYHCRLTHWKMRYHYGTYFFIRMEHRHDIPTPINAQEITQKSY